MYLTNKNENCRADHVGVVKVKKPKKQASKNK
jgi:hypothetical protein